LEQYGQWITHPPASKRGRPRIDKWFPKEELKYAQVIKDRQEGRLIEVIKGAVLGRDIDTELVSTSLITRLNLTLRQDNDLFSRKTIVFSKKIEWLKRQMNLYFANYHFCRGHRALQQSNSAGKVEICTPAKYSGLVDHNFSLKQLLAILVQNIN
jgi:hypothetical protein